LSPAQRATGRFFFIHKSEARSHDDRARNYEFLHATFGEFLVARLTANAVRDLAAMRQMLRHGVTTGIGQLDDGYLYAALSFTCLSGRAPVIGFLRELLTHLTADERASAQELLAELLASSLCPHPNRSFQEYEPVCHLIPRRLAAYSANLVLVHVLLAEKVQVSQLFGSAAVATKWRELGYIWRGMLTTTEWSGILNTMRLRVSRENGVFDIELAIEDGSPVSPADCIVATSIPWHNANAFDVLISGGDLVSLDADIAASSYAGRAFRDIAFTPSWHTSLLMLQALPFIHATSGEVRRETDGGMLILPGYLLGHLDYTRDAAAGSRAGFYQRCMELMASDSELREQLLLRLREDAWKFSPNTMIGLLSAANKAAPTDLYISLLNELWWRLGNDSKIREKAIDLLFSIYTSWPEVLEMGLDRHIISNIKAVAGERLG
jgi:hypothetical protein